MIPVSEAIQIVLQQTPRLATENIALAESLGRFLAEEIVADCDLPPFDRSQMDGYAVRAEDLLADGPTRLKIVGESAAGRGWHQHMGAGESVRIMTGAPVPEGADSVQQVELTREISEHEIEILEAVEPGRSVVKRGAEIKAGLKVLEGGERITAGMIAVLASFGYSHVNAGKRPRVTVMATGTELVEVDQKPGRDQIRDSNNYSIGAYAQLAGASIQRLPLAGDDAGLLTRQIDEASQQSDIVITSGGVSVGAYDFTKPALKKLGAEFFFERVALRPGKPTVFARLPGGALFFGLPGNPVSVSATFALFARVSILAMQGASETEMQRYTAVLRKSVKGAKKRESYLPAQLSTDDDGQLIAEPLKWGGSSDFVGFARATALINLPADCGLIDAGKRVKVLLLAG
jgi:molybdopterin molybdotransferase